MPGSKVLIRNLDYYPFVEYRESGSKWEDDEFEGRPLRIGNMAMPYENIQDKYRKENEPTDNR